MANDMSPGGLAEYVDLPQFLAGRTRAYGLFEDRFGRVRRRFLIDVSGTWVGSEFVLDEAFVYDSGETERRQWRLRPGPGGAVEATCDDCIGLAHGESDATTLRMRYRLWLRLGERRIAASFDDRFIRVDAGRMINRSTVRKWGIRLGEVFLVFEKMPREPHDQTWPSASAERA